MRKRKIASKRAPAYKIAEDPTYEQDTQEPISLRGIVVLDSSIPQEHSPKRGKAYNATNFDIILELSLQEPSMVTYSDNIETTFNSPTAQEPPTQSISTR